MPEVNFEFTVKEGRPEIKSLPAHLVGKVKIAEDGYLDIQLPIPNVIGQIMTPDGESDPYANLWVECENECTSWIGSDSQGNVAGYLMPGKYVVKVQPSWRSQGTYASNSYSLLVDEFEQSCILAYIDEGASCPVSNPLEFYLSVPNLSGEIWAGDNKVGANGGIRVEKFEQGSSKIDYENSLWTNVDESGKYKLNIQNPGSYQITFDNVQDSPGYTATTAYFVVAGANQTEFTFCAANKPVGNNEPVCDENPIRSPFVLDIDLKRANLELWATIPEIPFNWANGWVEGLGNSTGSSAEQINFSFSQGPNAKAYLNLGEIGLIKKYKIKMEFGTDDEERIQKNLVLWAGNFDDNVGTIEFCLDKFYVSGNVGVRPLCKDISTETAVDAYILESGRLDVEVTRGVFRGVVSTPESTPRKVKYAQVQVEKWTESNWGDELGIWKWTDNYANTDSEGRYSLDISSPGVYRVKVNIPWGSDNYPYAPSLNIIKVTNDAQGNVAICEHKNMPGDYEVLNFNFGECDPVTAGIVSKFKTPNVTGSISFGGKVTTDAWAGSYLLKTVICGPNCSYESRSWNGQMQMDDSGKFFASFLPGNYIAEASPNGELAGLAVKTETQFSINDEGLLRAADGSSINALNLSLATPNIRGKVCRLAQTSPCIPAEWTHVSVSDKTNWTKYYWANTNEDGEFSLLLENGSYEFRLYASNAIEQGTNSTFDVVVTGTTPAQLCAVNGGTPSPCSALLTSLDAPNVSGTMMYQLIPNEPIPVEWSWIHISNFSYGSYFWTSSGTNAFGEFALSLPKETVSGASRTYQATAYYYGEGQRAPLDFLIKSEFVPANGSVSAFTKFFWKYPSQSKWPIEPVTSNNLKPDFDFVKPNTEIKLVGVLGDGKRVLKIVSDEEGTEGVTRRIFKITTSGTSGNNVAEINLPVGTLANVRVIPEVGEVLVGCQSGTVTPLKNNGDVVQNKLVIDVGSACQP